MTDTIRAIVTGDREAAAGITASGSAVNVAARRVLAEIGEDLRGRVRNSAGRFPRVSGRLQDRIKMKIFEGRKGLRVDVYPGVPYGFMLEVGSKKNQVMRRGHTRRVEARDARATFDVGGKSRRKLASKGVAFVKEHPVKVNLQPHPFVQPAVSGMEAAIHMRIQGAIVQAIEESRGA